MKLKTRLIDKAIGNHFELADPGYKNHLNQKYSN